MKKVIFLLLIIVAATTIHAQVIEMRNYDWDKKPVLSKPDSNELKESAVVLKYKRTIEYVYNKEGDLEEYFFQHKIIRINEDKAIEDYNKIYVGIHNPDDLIAFKARSISPKGVVKEMLRGEMKNITESGSRYLILAIDGLEKGSVLEYFYVEKLSTAYFLTERMQTSVLSKNVDFTLISPENLIFDSKSYNGFPSFKDTVINKKRFLQASLPVVKPGADEKYSAYKASLMRAEFRLSKNTAQGTNKLLTWGDAGKSYYSRVKTVEKGELKDLDKLASKLKLKGMKTDEEKIRAIENYVKTNISSEGQTEDISEILNKNYATEFGITRLTAGLLNQAGLSYEIVSNSNRFEQKFDADFESWNYLDEVFFYFPSLGKYLAPTNYGYRLGLIPYQYMDNDALFIKEVSLGDIKSGIGAIKRVKESKIEESHQNMEATVNFTSSMDKVTQHTRQDIMGYAAVGLRPYYYYSTKEKKDELIKDQLKSGIEDAQLTNIKCTNSDLNTDEVNKPFIVEGDLSYTSLLEKAGNTYIFKVGAIIGPQVEMYQDKPREYDIEFEFPHTLDRTITITIPDGFTFKGLDALNINVTDGANNTMGFVSSYKLEGKKLVITIHEYYAHCHYPITVFDQFRKVINASADFNKVALVIEKNK